jgi:hypothetical protein
VFWAGALAFLTVFWVAMYFLSFDLLGLMLVVLVFGACATLMVIILTTKTLWGAKCKGKCDCALYTLVGDLIFLSLVLCVQWGTRDKGRCSGEGCSSRSQDYANGMNLLDAWVGFGFIILGLPGLVFAGAVILGLCMGSGSGGDEPRRRVFVVVALVAIDGSDDSATL